MIEKLINWFTVEPTISMLMVTTAIVLFSSAFQAYKDTSGNFWPWMRRILMATVSAILFLGLLWGFRMILNDNMSTFYATHGSLSDTSRASAWSIWGRPHRQIELTVHHYHEIEISEEIPREDITQLPVYRTVTQREEVLQNSITGFVGDVQMRLSEREKGYALYSGFILDTTFTYEIVNNSSIETESIFSFPLSEGQTLFENLIITMDGQNMSSDLRFEPNIISWTTIMQPRQESEIVVTYSSRGMDYFYYQIPIQREIKNFILTLTIDRLPVTLMNYPDGVITPTDIQPTADGQGSILTWELDRAVTVAGMGVSLIQPEQPGAQVLRVLVLSSYALTLLGVMLALTMMVWGLQVKFLDLSLLLAVYTMQFLLMAAISDYFFGFWGSLLIGAVLTLSLSYLLFRKLPSRSLRIVIYILIAFFTIVYPLSGLLTELAHQNAFNMLLQVGLILYITILSLYARKQALDVNISASVAE